MIPTFSFRHKDGEEKDVRLRKWDKRVQLNEIIGNTLCNHLAENYRVSLSCIKKCFARNVSSTSLWMNISSCAEVVWSKIAKHAVNSG